MAGSLLTINGGSSSIKFALFAPGEPPRRVLTGQIERIGAGQQQPTLSAAMPPASLWVRIRLPPPIMHRRSSS